MKAKSFPFNVGEMALHRRQGKVRIGKITEHDIKFTNMSGCEFRMSHNYANEILSPITAENNSNENEIFNFIEQDEDSTIRSKDNNPLFINPRSYQREALTALTKAFTQFNRVILSLPTGSGKTFIAAKWLCDHVINQGGKAIWIAHRVELLEQAYNTFVKLLPYNKIDGITWWAGNKEKNSYGKLVLVSVMASKSFPNIHADIIVIDEAHHEPAITYRNIQKKIKCKKNLGLTATPIRLDEKKLGYESIAYQKTFMSLVNEGWIARPEPVVPKTGFNFKMNKRMDDFSDESLANLDTKQRNKFIAKHWSENYEKYQKTLVFAINRNHAKKLAYFFREYNPQHKIEYIVSGKGNHQERQTKISKFKIGDIDILINCKIFTEGFDCPDVKTIFVTRPTLSSSLYLQMIGRGTRITKTKKSFYLVDFEDNLGNFQQELIKPWYLCDELTINSENNKLVKAQTTKEKELPKCIQEELRLEAIDQSSISGYVVYSQDNGKGNGFLVHNQDEKTFLTLWNHLLNEALTNGEKQLAKIVLEKDQEFNNSRLSLQSFIPAAMALSKNSARYIRLKENTLNEATCVFLQETDITDEEINIISHDLYEIYALLKIKDEIDGKYVIKKIYENEKDDFDKAFKELSQNLSLRSNELDQFINNTHKNYLMDTDLTIYEWRRFTIYNIKHPNDSICYVDIFEEDNALLHMQQRKAFDHLTMNKATDNNQGEKQSDSSSMLLPCKLSGGQTVASKKTDADNHRCPPMSVSKFKTHAEFSDGLNVDEKKDLNDVMYYFKTKGVEAKGYPQDTKNRSTFTVVKGSCASMITTKSMSSNLQRKRKELIYAGKLKVEERSYKFTEDCNFSSPSEAACIIAGNSRNGLDAWKDGSNRSLKEKCQK